MKFFQLLLSVAFLTAGIAAVNGKLTTEQQHGKTSTATMTAVKPTTAPLMTTTLATNKANKMQVLTTKAPIKAHNTTKKVAAKNADKNVSIKPTEKTTMDKDMLMEALPIQKPATVEHSLMAEESRPLAVTGFITKNGNIYEIENANGSGIGKIQSRQADEEKDHICNYGAVVIYSDIPCEQVTNVKISEVEDKPAFDQADNKPTETNNNNDKDKETENKEKDEDEEEDTDKEQKKPARRRVNSKRRKKNKKTKAQKQNKNRNSNKNSRRRSQQQRGSQQKRRRQQQQNNRRRWEEYDDDDVYDYDDERQYQRKRNQRKGQRRRQQAQRYTSDYYDDDY